MPIKTPRPLSLAALIPVVICAAFATSASKAEATEAEGHPCLSICEEGEPPSRFSMLVLNVGWESDFPATSRPLNEELLTPTVKDLAGRVSDWFRRASGGAHPGWQLTAGASIRIQVPAALEKEDCQLPDIKAAFSVIVARANAAAEAIGFDPSAYHTVAYRWDGGLCGAGGIRSGKAVGIGGESAAIHELGHRLGLEHAQSLACTDPATTNPVPLSAVCGTTEYGDVFDPMGKGEGIFNAMYLARLEWMPPSQVIDLSAGEYSRTVTLAPLSDPTRGPRAIRLLDGPTTLWIEYHQRGELDLGELGAPGVFVHRELGPNSQLLDMTPDTSAETSIRNPSLPVGQTWANPLGGMKISVNSVGPEAATVTISAQLATVPNLTGKTESAAKSALSSAGLAFGGRESFRDPTCEFIQTVKTQNPAAGTRVPPGTAVRVSIGEEDPRHRCR